MVGQELRTGALKAATAVRGAGNRTGVLFLALPVSMVRDARKEKRMALALSAAGKPVTSRS
jgi:hypothetical protein